MCIWCGGNGTDNFSKCISFQIPIFWRRAESADFKMAFNPKKESNVPTIIRLENEITFYKEEMGFFHCGPRHSLIFNISVNNGTCTIC